VAPRFWLSRAVSSTSGRKENTSARAAKYINPNLTKYMSDEMKLATNAEMARLFGWTFAHIEKAACGGDVYENAWFPPGIDPHQQSAEWINENGYVSPKNYTGSRDAIIDAVLTLPPHTQRTIVRGLRSRTTYPELTTAQNWCDAVKAVINGDVHE